MKKYLPFLLLLICNTSFADITESLNIEEEDGSPSTYPYKLKVSNGSLTDNADGTSSLAFSSVAGSNTQVQFNDGGAFGADAGMVYNKTTDSLSLNGDITISGDNITAGTNTDRFVFMANGTTYAPEAINLGTDTTGNYVVDVAGTANEITVSHTPSEGSTATVSLPAEIDIGAKTSFEIPNAAAPTVDVFGEIAGDNNLWAASRGAPIFFDGTASTALVNVLVSDAPGNLEVPKWNSGGTITWEADSGAVAGSNAQIQYNNAGTQAGDQAFTWDDDRNILGISRDAGQTGFALVISADTGLVVASISKDGGITGQSLMLAQPLSVDQGGTGVTTLTDGGILIGNATGDIVAMAVLAKGSLAAGDGATDPAELTVGANGTHLSADSSTATGLVWTSAIGYTEVADEGTLLTQRRAINFVGAGVTATDTSSRTTVTIPSDTPGGANTNVQFNDSSSFGGELSFTWNKSLNVLGISKDNAQTGWALVISDDTGKVVGNFSKDGSVYADRLQVDKRISVGAANGGSISVDVGGSFRSVPIQLTDGATITANASQSNTFWVTLAGQPRTLAKPTNGTAGQKITFKISQDATGSRKIGFAAGIELGADITSFDASTTAGRNDYIGMIHNGISWDVVSVSKGFGG